jgi:pterin-4a-carbinolamine dehydratase
MGNLLDDLSTDTIKLDGFSPDELARELHALGPRWSLVEGALHLALPGPMTRTGVAAAFVGTLAEELEHYPQVALDRDGMTLSIRTHGARSVTVIDLVFAARVEQWLRANGWPT